MSDQPVETLIVSDFHLGLWLSRPVALLKVLREVSYQRLIINGDVFDDLNFKRLDDDHWEVLEFIRNFAKTHEVIWIIGNHDGEDDIFSHLLGVKVHKEYEWTSGNLKCLATHGDQFDRFLHRNPIFSDIATLLYYAVQYFDGRDAKFSGWFKTHTGAWIRQCDIVAAGAAAYGRARGVGAIFCGHTHLPAQKDFGDIKYYNSGCWTDRPSTYITVDQGEVKLVEVM